MKSAEAPDQFRAIDRNDPPFRETILENFVGALVPGRTEDRQKDNFVGNVKICVAGGEAAAFLIDSRRHWQRANFERRAVFGFHCSEQRQVRL